MLTSGAALLRAADDAGQAGPLGLFVILVLAAATLLLVRSMRSHLRRIPRSFDGPPDAPGGADPGRSDDDRLRP